jgi:hypothetical protein
VVGTLREYDGRKNKRGKIKNIKEKLEKALKI